MTPIKLQTSSIYDISRNANENNKQLLLLHNSLCENVDSYAESNILNVMF